MEADGALACSLTHMNEYIMKSASPKICERVNYWVHYECGRVPGMYLTDARCQPPAGFPLERLATSGSFMEISLDKSIYKMGDTMVVSGNAYTSVGLPEKNLGIKIIDSDGHKILEYKNTVNKAGHFGFNILTGTSISITKEGNYELVIVDYGKFGSTGIKKFTVSNDGLPIQIPTTQPIPPTSQNSMSSMSSHTSPDSPIILHTEKKEYAMGESITLNGIVKFVNNKAVGVGLPRDLNVAIEVYDSKNSFIESHVLKAKNDDTFVLTLDTGDSSKISKKDQYHFVAYYGLVNSKLLNSDYVGRHDVYVGENVLSSPATISPVPLTSPNLTPTNPPMDWTSIAGLLIVVGFVVIIVVKKRGLLGNSTSSKFYNNVSTQQHVVNDGRHSTPNSTPSGSESTQGKTPRSPRSRNEIDEKDLRNYFSRFSWEDMENITGSLFRKKGYKVEVTRKTKDQGIDVKAKRGDDELIFIQVKFWKGAIGIKDVQATLGASGNATKVIVISVKHTFTKDAMNWVTGSGNQYRLKLWDGERFTSEIRNNMKNGIFKIS